ncbi:class I SAM-dependent methyltransferase [Actinoplanes sp. NPDC026619]|uniref:class I SAM-dependent methyltransferase n=1 Tax=Actinoplanes sp. NPDC026619 TaxID=3155798 RepID=UPI0034047604
MMERLRKITPTQAVLLAAAIVLGTAIGGSSLTGHVGLALAVLGVVLACLAAGLVLVLHRLAVFGREQRRAYREQRAVLDQTQRRVLGAVEQLLLTAGDRHRELTELNAAAQKAAANGTDRLLRAQTGEVEALVQLFQGFTPRAPMPSSGGFALNPTDLLDLLHLIQVRRPKLVLELGSGTSTVWIAYALEKAGGRLVSLDHDPGYAEKTRIALAAHGLTEVAEVRDAPLRPVVLDGRTFPYYDTTAVADLRGVDLLLIDGPPEKTGKDARYPAMRVLEDRLADNATVVFDDAHRQDEAEALRKWVETIEGLTQEEGEARGRHAVLSYRRIVRQLTPAQ